MPREKILVRLSSIYCDKRKKCYNNINKKANTDIRGGVNMKFREVPKNSWRGTEIQFHNFCWKIVEVIGGLIFLKLMFSVLFALL